MFMKVETTCRVLDIIELASRTLGRSAFPKGFKKLLLLVPLLGSPQVAQTGASITKLSGSMFITTQRHSLQPQADRRRIAQLRSLKKARTRPNMSI